MRSSKPNSNAVAKTPSAPSRQFAKEFAAEKIDTQDGIRIDWPDAWVHARPSNTEPIMRIIAEAPDRATADQQDCGGSSRGRSGSKILKSQISDVNFKFQI